MPINAFCILERKTRRLFLLAQIRMKLPAPEGRGASFLFRRSRNIIFQSFQTSKNRVVV